MGRTKFRTRNQFRGRHKKVIRSVVRDQLKKAITVPSETVSPSARKFELLNIDLEENEEQHQETSKSSDCFMLIQKDAINKLLAVVACSYCFVVGQVKLEIVEGRSMGLSVRGNLICQCCNECLGEDYLCQRVGDSKLSSSPFEVNIRGVMAFRSIGCGHAAVQNWCGLMNMPCSISKDSYQVNQNKLHEGSKATCETVMQKTVAAIFNSYEDIGVKPDKDGILDIGVSFDGTWQKRGHSSHNGAGAVIDLLTGLPIDSEVLCNFCYKCTTGPKETEADYGNWAENHKPNCQKNYDGSANSMETECARRIWSRSIKTFSLRYMTMVSDGDSKSHKELVKSKVYGEERTIEKEECVNHVAKRMGAALNNLVIEAKSQGSSVSGKGKLTKEKIVKIQNYYGKAIKDNAEDINVMKKRIFAILFHLTSNEDNPKHMHCPTGEDSWCFWNRAKAKGEEPGKHKEHTTLPVEIGKRLVPIFKRLTDENLLKRCRNKTQNPNECLHSIIWKICPKSTFSGKRMVEIGVNMAMCQFAMGTTFQETLCHALGLMPGKNLAKAAKKRSIERVVKAAMATSDEEKLKRKRKKYARTKNELEKKRSEGETYKAGSFD